MYSVWTKHLQEQEQKEQFKNSVKSSKPVLDRVLAILKEEETAIQNAEINPKIYDAPNWDYKMAHDNGFKQCLKIVMNLLDLDQQDKGLTPNDKFTR